MSWRTVILTKEAKLSLRMNHLVVTNDDIVRIPLVELGTLIIENTNIIITVHLLNALAENKTTVIVCDDTHNPSIFVQSIYGHHRQSKHLIQQFKWDEDVKGELWKRIIQHKIKLQKELLISLQRDGVDELQAFENEVERHDVTNREGLAAKIYFNRLFGEGFIRGDETPINWALDYGYSILHSLVSRTIVSKGYLTEIGIHHINEFNQFNLASDLVEVFRPLVDSVVFDNVKNEFNTAERRKLIGILEKKVFIRNGEHYLPQAVQLYVESCLQFLLKAGDEKVIFPTLEYVKL